MVENVAQLVINRGKSGTESLRKGDLLQIIAESKKKTDKVDARILADMLRGGYIAECHVPTKQALVNLGDQITQI